MIMNVLKKNECQPLVSIVIPLYNSERFIERCLLSVINQTYDNIEVVIIDDGSTDNGKSIVLKYKKNNSRIFLYSQKNGGPGCARNKGIEVSKGDFIIFIDADDYISENLVHSLYKVYKDDTLCFVRTNLTKTIYKESNHNFINDYIHTRKGIPYGCLGKLYNSSIIKANNIRFNDKIKCDEDLFFNIDYFKFIKEGKYVRDACYYVTIHNDSLTKVRKKDNMDIYKTAYQYIKENIGDSVEYDNSFALMILLLNDTINQIKHIKFFEFKKFSYIIKKIIDDKTVKYIIDKRWRKFISDDLIFNYEKILITIYKLNKVLFVISLYCFCNLVKIKEFIYDK